MSTGATEKSLHSRVMNYEELKSLLDNAGVPAYLGSEYYDIKGEKST